MSELAHLSRFIKFWFAHASLKTQEIQTPHSFQISCLASAYRKQVLKVPFENKEMAFLPEFFAANEGELVETIRAENGRGIDMFFFANAVRPGFDGKSPTNEDIERRLFFPIDFDYRLPVSLEDIESELGLQFAAVTISSQREHKHHQAFIALAWESVSDEDRLDTTTLARRICRAFGSDNVADMRRVMRLPGLINWKTAELEPKGGSKSDTALVRADVGREYEFDEIESAISKFEQSEMSEQFRSLRVTPVREGGTAQGERGEFGRWDKVLSAARAGVVTLKKGSRHNALASWGCQMASARLPWFVVEENLFELARGAFDVAYDTDEPEDFARLKADLKKKWATIDEELDLLDAGRADEIDAAMSTEQDWAEDPFADFIIRIPKPTAEETASVRDHLASSERLTEFVEHFAGPMPVLDFGPEARGPSSLLHFARQAAQRCAGESEEHWLSWLGECITGANFFDIANAGSIGKLCVALQRRLEFVGAVREGRLHGPLVSFSGKQSWSMKQLNDAESRLLVRNLCFTASELLCVKEIRKNVWALAAVQGAHAAKSKPKTAFGAKGELLSQVEREMMIRVKSRVQFGASSGPRRRVFAFQNGVFDLDLWEKIVEENVEPWDISSESGAKCLSARLFEPWKKNPTGKPDELDRNVSWVSHENCCACSFGVPTAYVNGNFEKFWLSCRGTVEAGEQSGSDELDTPLFDRFLADCFGEDLEAARGVLLIIAYCLLPDNPLQRYFFFEGVGGAGKGTLATLVGLLVGEQNTESVEISRIQSDAWLGPLEGKGLVLIDESEHSDPRAMRRTMHELARVTGASRVSARSLHADARTIRAGWRFILIANVMPDAADKSGQQARRAVPVYFGRQKKVGVVRELAEKIYYAEGDRIVTKAVVEYLTNGLPRGESIFEIDSPAFTIGRERFEDSTSGLRRILRVFGVGNENMAKMLVEACCVLWCGRKEGRDYLLKNLDRSINSEMALLGMHFKPKLRMPWKGVDGESDRLAGFQGCSINTEALLEELEMTPDELLRALRVLSEGKKKLWEAGKSMLDLPVEEFNRAEGHSSGQRDLF